MSEPRLPTTKDPGRAIRRVRQTKHLTIKAAARKAGMSAGHLGVIERGHSNPRLKTLFSLADALGVTVAEIMRAAEAELVRSGERRPAPEEFGQAERALQRRSAPRARPSIEDARRPARSDTATLAGR
jgi:transcriptional regulator with XRE-family HTH domain